MENKESIQNEQNTQINEQNPEINEQTGAENEQPEFKDASTDNLPVPEPVYDLDNGFTNSEVIKANQENSYTPEIQTIPLGQFQKLSDDYNAVAEQNVCLEEENKSLSEKLQIANESIRQEQVKVLELAEALAAKPQISSDTKYVFAACSRTDYILGTDYKSLLNEVSLLPTTKHYEIFLSDGSLLDIKPEITIDDVKAKTLCRLEKV